MQRIHFSCLTFVVVLNLFLGWSNLCVGSAQERLVVRDGKKLICTVLFQDSLDVDCGTKSYSAVFTAKILAVSQVRGRSSPPAADALGDVPASDLRLSVAPEEVFKGRPSPEAQIFAKQGECFAEVHVGDEWLFFAETGPKTKGLEISFYLSNPSGPIEQRREYIDRLRRLALGEGLSFVAGNVEFPDDDFSKEYLSKERPDYGLVISSKGEKRNYSAQTDDQGRFEIGPVAPDFYSIDANTDSKFRDVRDGFTGAVTEPNGCSLVRVELQINSELSGSVILPEGYTYKKSNMGNFFPLFYVDVDTLDGKQAGFTSIGDGLRFTVTGLRPGSYIVQLVNFEDSAWLRRPVFAPGVTDQAAALRIDLGWAEKRTDLQITVPPNVLRGAH